jgi:hypothetical protein
VLKADSSAAREWSASRQRYVAPYVRCDEHWYQPNDCPVDVAAIATATPKLCVSALQFFFCVHLTVRGETAIVLRKASSRAQDAADTANVR